MNPERPSVPPDTQHCAETSAHVLIIDDDLISLRLMIEYLRDGGVAVSTATNGTEGLGLARSTWPDLILLDLQMPTPDGFEVLGCLKDADSTRDIPVLLLTACADLDSKMRGFALGADDYLTKPLAAVELRARVTAHLHQRRRVSVLEQRLHAYEQRYGCLNQPSTNTERFDLQRQEVLRLHRARQLLGERLADPPTLDDLAQLVGTNQPRLSRGFRILFGTTVFGFIREARLVRSRELLIETRWPIKVIALEVGYRNTGDLSRGIKERFGMTPTELRARAAMTSVEATSSTSDFDEGA